MKEFEILFGIKGSQVKENCILMPIITKNILKELKLKKLSKGKLYNSGNSRNFTLIHTRVGAGFTGDAVLHLKDTPCKNIILFGSCGLIPYQGNLSIGSLFCPSKCYSSEGFSNTLLKTDKLGSHVFYPDKSLLRSLLNTGQKTGINKAICLTIPSLKLEEEKLSLLIKKGIQIVDMECSAVFAAAKYAGIKTAALFYASDIIKTNPFYLSLTPAQETTLSSAIKKSVSCICKLIKKNLGA
ncbi:MAG: hypothetical protein ABIC18_02940 [Candidatus Omnitrophota bacterium]